MNNNILSICIPSHNRVNMLESWIIDIAKINDSRFDVIISDTSDNKEQKSLLNKIKNSSTKITVINNPPDTLPTQNWLIALTNGNGNFVMHVNDRDAIRPDNLKSFLDFLEDNSDCLGGICHDHGYSYVDKTQLSSEMFTKDPLLCYKQYHPTGLVFRSSRLKNTENLELIFDRNFEDYPHSLLLGRFSMYGKMFIYYPQVWTRPSREWYRNNQSGIVMLDKRFFLSPNRCVLQAKRYTSEIDSFDVPETLKKCWRREVIRRGVLDCTIYYFNALSDSVASSHWLGSPQSLSSSKKCQMINDALEQFKSEFHCNTLKFKIEIYCRLLYYYIVRHTPNLLKISIKKCLSIYRKLKAKEL